MPLTNLKRKKILFIVIIISFSLGIATIVVYAKESKIVDRIITTEGSYIYSSNPNRPFLHYEIRVMEGGTINFNEILLNETLPIPTDWGVEVTVLSSEGWEVEGVHIGDLIVYSCPTRNVTLSAYQISYLLVNFTIEVEAVYYEAVPIILYLICSVAFVWINYLTFILIKKRKETEKWFKPFRK